MGHRPSHAGDRSRSFSCSLCLLNHPHTTHKTRRRKNKPTDPHPTPKEDMMQKTGSCLPRCIAGEKGCVHCSFFNVFGCIGWVGSGFTQYWQWTGWSVCNFKKARGGDRFFIFFVLQRIFSEPGISAWRTFSWEMGCLNVKRQRMTLMYGVVTWRRLSKSDKPTHPLTRIYVPRFSFSLTRRIISYSGWAIIRNNYVSFFFFFLSRLKKKKVGMCLP